MRKIVLASLVAILTVGAAFAQGGNFKVDPDGIQKKIAKADEDIENPKKNTKSGTWIDRGKVYQDAATASWSNLYRGIPIEQVQLFYGSKVEPATETVNGQEYELYDYPSFTGYFTDGMLAFWKPKLSIVDNAYEEAYNSYIKAYEIDPKSAAKVKLAMIQLSNDHKKEAENYYGQQDYLNIAKHFDKAYEVQAHPSVNEIDTVSIYNAGMFYTFASEFDKGMKLLEKADELGYQSDGDVYYFLYYNYYGLEMVDKAKDILVKGISLYPGNTKIVEALVGIYSVTESDPTEIIDIVKKSIDAEPDNHLLWGGLGGIYQKMENYDDALTAYQKAVDIEPGDFYNNFRLAYAYIELGDDANKKLNESNPSSSEEYNKALEGVFQFYEQAVPPLEKAHEIDPSNEATIELLKNLTFRLRDRDDSFMQKYEKYNELFQNL